MKTIYLGEEQIPGKVGYHGSNESGLPKSQSLQAQVNRSGDVEIVHVLKGESKLLTVIPKSKRAELAQFLVEAE